MKSNRLRQGWQRAAAMPVALALALGPLALATAARAQEERLPSVSDYRLPDPSTRPAVRPQGPIDSENPVVLRPPGSPTAEPRATSQPRSTSVRALADPARSANRPRAALAAPASAPAPATVRIPAAAAPAPGTANTPPPAGSATSTAPFNGAAAVPPAAGYPADPARPRSSGDAVAGPVPPFEWNLHSAKSGAWSSIWPWLAGIAGLLACNALLLFMLLRRRKARAAAEFEAEERAVRQDRRYEPAPGPGQQAAGPAPAGGSGPEPHAPAASLTAARPALDVIVNPLEVTLAARRLSATLMNTVLNYELVIANIGDGPIGPVSVAGDMIGAHASLPTRMQLEMSGNDIAPQHRIERLAPGESTMVSGELRLPLAAITPIRSGNASLFVPLARFRVEALRDTAPPLSLNRTFVVGESPDRPDAALKPFRLDLGPRLYSRLGQREVAAIA